MDFGGVKNLLSAFQAGLGVGGGQDVLQMPGVASGFGSLDDVVMGGVSESSARVATAGDSGLVFSGVVRTENNGGFASVRTRNLEPRLDLSAGSGLRLRLSGGAGLRYKVLLRTDPAFDAVGYACSFDTSKLSENEWEEVESDGEFLQSHEKTRKEKRKRKKGMGVAERKKMKGNVPQVASITALTGDVKIKNPYTAGRTRQYPKNPTEKKIREQKGKTAALVANDGLTPPQGGPLRLMNEPGAMLGRD